MRWQSSGVKGVFPDLGGGRNTNLKIEVVRALRVGGQAWRKNSNKNKEFQMAIGPGCFGL